MVLARKRFISGFSLLEIMIAVAFFAIAFVSLMDAYNRGVFADIYLDQAAIAVNLAQESIDELRRGTYASITVGTTTENPVAGFTSFRRITAVTQTSGINSNYKTVTITVSWQLKGTWQDYQLRTYIADY
ncbi:MAG: type II secretion system protein [Candidatus Omnitrophota bacterium]|nr:type II secretion system protein [Candidatus Omnitrophota bacterium]